MTSRDGLKRLAAGEMVPTAETSQTDLITLMIYQLPKSQARRKLLETCTGARIDMNLFACHPTRYSTSNSYETNESVCARETTERGYSSNAE
jgi:hypothetical protein